MNPAKPTLVQWPLWSWRNFTVTVVGILGALFLVGQVTGAPSSAVPSGATRGGGTTPPHAATAPVTAPSPTAPSTSAAAPLPSTSARAAVLALLDAWVSDDPAGAGRRMTPELAAASTEQSAPPVTRVTAAPKAVQHTSTEETWRVGTDAGQLIVTSQHGPTGWLVSDVVPVGDVPTAPKPSVGPTRSGP